MPETLQFSTLVFPRAGRDQQERSNRQNISAEGALAGGGSIVDDLASLPGEQTMSGVYLGDYARKQTDELDELVSGDDISAIPVFAPNGESSLAGYYVLESGRTRPETAQNENVQRFDVGLTRKGSRKSHWRQITTKPGQVKNDFGTVQESRVGIPDIATKRRWLDPETGSTQLADSPTATVTGEWGDVALYDPYNSPLTTETPALIYDTPYSSEEDVDVRVWDTRGFDSKTDGDGRVQWQKVFSREHDYSGAAVLDTGRLRVTVDEDASTTISAERWDATNDVWSSVSLGTSDWEVLDLDVARLGLERVTAYVLFTNPSTGEVFPLDGTLRRGVEDVLWAIPANTSGPVPSGLVDLLDPIASSRIIDAGESKTLHARRSTRD